MEQLVEEKKKIVPKVKNQLLVGLVAGAIVSVFAIDYNQAITVSDALLAIATILGPVIIGQAAGFLAAYRTTDPEREAFYKIAEAMIDGAVDGSIDDYIKAILNEVE